MTTKVTIQPPTVNGTSSRNKIAKLGEDGMMGTTLQRSVSGHELLRSSSGEESQDEYSIIGAAIIVIAIMAGILCAVILACGAVMRWAQAPI